MKRIIITALLLQFAIALSAQVPSASFYEKYASAEGAESVKMGNFLLSLAQFIISFSDDIDDEKDAALKIMSNLNSVEIIDISDCSEKVKKEFNQESSKIKLSGYELISRIKDDDDDLRIFIKQKKQKISELLLIIAGEDPTMIRLKGEITQQELKEFTKTIQSEY